jgi:serine phosphatase RsbU (regulator of sigma subunit)
LIILSHSLFANKVIDGSIDLSDQKFEDQTYPLDGAWLFSWNTDFEEFNATQTISVPGFWNHKKNGSFPTFGQACYRVQIKLPPTQSKLALRINNIHNSYRLYLDDSLVHEQGKPSKSPTQQKADWSPFLLPIHPPKSTFNLTFVVANFGHRNAGFASSITIGDYEKMIKDREFYMSIDAIIIGGLFILGIFLLSMYILWKRDQSLLYFFGFSLVFGLWTSFRDEKVFFSIWKTFDWELALRIEYSAMIVAVSFFIIYISTLFPKQNIKLMQRTVLTINALALILILFFPPHIFSYVAVSNIITLVLSMIYVMLVFTQVIKSKETNNIFTSISLALLYGVLLLKVLNFLNIVEINNTIVDITTLLFVLSMGLIFANRFSGIFNSTLALKEQAEQQRKDLKVKNKEILASIKYAKHLQSTILPTTAEMNAIFENSFVFFEPKDIVSGDFYWLEQHNDLIYFAVADCTGHGVPGAMVSFVCSNALTQAIIEESHTHPHHILDRTREIVIQRFSTSEVSLNDGMDISLGVFNPTSQLLEWSGANNPIWIVKKEDNTIIEYRGNKQPIGNYATALKPFDLRQIKLQKGDRIYLFSDGYIDQFGGTYGKKFKSNNLKKLVSAIQSTPIQQQQTTLSEAFYEWQGDFEQIDDVCVLGIEI